jgi:hypothetical protein
MDATSVTALAGIVGSLCGGTASFATAWLTQKTRAKRDGIRAELRKREALYGEFIDECSKHIMDALDRNLDKPERLLSIYALLNRIRLCASDAVLVQALELVNSSWSNTSRRIFPSKNFTHACTTQASIRSRHSVKPAAAS